MKTVLAYLGFFLIFAFLSGFIFVKWGGNLNWIVSSFNRANYDRWVSQFDAYGVTQSDVVFLGDSITEWGIWHELFPDIPVRNRGIAGDNTEGVLGRLDSIVSGKPNKIFLMIGTNDLLGGVPEKTIVENITKIVDRIKKESPRTQIYVQSILPRRSSYTSQIRSINLKIHAATQSKATWIDLFPLFLNEDGTAIDSALSNDKLHLNAKGYLLWRNAIYDEVLSDLDSELTSVQK